MGRQKVKLQYIENSTSRRVTYKKRVKNILKQTEELSVLCGEDACTIVYGENDEVPEVWPSSHAKVARILLEYKDKAESEDPKRKFSHDTFMRQSVTKTDERMNKLEMRNRELGMENLMVHLLSGKPVEQVPYGDVKDLTWVIDDKMRELQRYITMLEAPVANAPAANPNQA